MSINEKNILITEGELSNRVLTRTLLRQHILESNMTTLHTPPKGKKPEKATQLQPVGDASGAFEPPATGSGTSGVPPESTIPSIGNSAVVVDQTVSQLGNGLVGTEGNSSGGTTGSGVSEDTIEAPAYSSITGTGVDRRESSEVDELLGFSEAEKQNVMAPTISTGGNPAANRKTNNNSGLVANVGNGLAAELRRMVEATVSEAHDSYNESMRESICQSVRAEVERGLAELLKDVGNVNRPVLPVVTAEPTQASRSTPAVSQPFRQPTQVPTASQTLQGTLPRLFQHTTNHHAGQILSRARSNNSVLANGIQQSGNQPGYQPGYQTGYQPGYQPGTQTGYQPGYQPGTQPGYQPGYLPGYLPGYQHAHQQNPYGAAMGPTSGYPQPGFSPYGYPNMSTRTPIRIDKWGISFNGKPEFMTVEEFIFQVEFLQIQHQCTWTEVLRDFHILLSGGAKVWYWQFQRTMVRPEWSVLKDALMREYRNSKSDFEIIQEIMDRKQGPGESSDDFFASVNKLRAQLRVQTPEIDLVRSLKKNLNERISKLVYPQYVYTMDQLKLACKEAEYAFPVKEREVPKHPRPQHPGRYVAHELEMEAGMMSYPQEQLEAFQHSGARPKSQAKSFTCWNCRLTGHSWLHCPEPRIIFCYGCGKEGVISTKCTECKPENPARNAKSVGDSRSTQTPLDQTKSN
ncbi:uncharacterized protein LOC129907301 [Episyrphus balteatus]|uniref:uncharacterized protein LOC129907301 n=1 Tax=Episyrphus balteatus TaxID=286459 RepID=UPI002484E9EC|nr:uncharacterized protein LOC129907301 [Episyrphus balteatus]